MQRKTKNEEKFTTLEEKRPDALEVAAQAHEEREAQTGPQVIPVPDRSFLSRNISGLGGQNLKLYI